MPNLASSGNSNEDVDLIGKLEPLPTMQETPKSVADMKEVIQELFEICQDEDIGKLSILYAKLGKEATRKDVFLVSQELDKVSRKIIIHNLLDRITQVLALGEDFPLYKDFNNFYQQASSPDCTIKQALLISQQANLLRSGVMELVVQQQRSDLIKILKNIVHMLPHEMPEREKLSALQFFDMNTLEDIESFKQYMSKISSSFPNVYPSKESIHAIDLQILSGFDYPNALEILHSLPLAPIRSFLADFNQREAVPVRVSHEPFESFPDATPISSMRLNPSSSSEVLKAQENTKVRSDDVGLSFSDDKTRQKIIEDAVVRYQSAKQKHVEDPVKNPLSEEYRFIEETIDEILNSDRYSEFERRRKQYLSEVENDCAIEDKEAFVEQRILVEELMRKTSECKLPEPIIHSSEQQENSCKVANQNTLDQVQQKSLPSELERQLQALIQSSLDVGAQEITSDLFDIAELYRAGSLNIKMVKDELVVCKQKILAAEKEEFLRLQSIRSSGHATSNSRKSDSKTNSKFAQSSKLPFNSAQETQKFIQEVESYIQKNFEAYPEIMPELYDFVDALKSKPIKNFEECSKFKEAFEKIKSFFIKDDDLYDYVVVDREYEKDGDES